jgi:hypothetical protein
LVRTAAHYGGTVKKLWIHPDIDAPAEAAWELLKNPELAVCRLALEQIGSMVEAEKVDS